jgi:endonuclease III
MATRTTRAAAAKGSAVLTSTDMPKKPQQLSSPPPTPPSAKAKPPRATKATRKSLLAKGKNAKLSAAKPDAEVTALKSSEESYEHEPPATPAASKETSAAAVATPPNTSRKRKRATAVKVNAKYEELPHGLGRVLKGATVKTEDEKEAIDPLKLAPDADAVTLTKADVEDIKDTLETTIAANALATPDEPAKKKRRTKKANPYGVTLGETPYPDLLRPTPEECEEINTILSKEHGAVAAPKKIPPPSLTVAGCGEVPCVLEALIRTVLSAHTSNGNAGLAVQGLIKRFGILQSGMSKGCIDWNAARLAGPGEIEKAIKSGGMAPKKSKHIAEILELVYKENQERRAALASRPKEAKSEDSKTIDPSMDTVDPDYDEAKKIEEAAEATLADTNALTLDYIHAMSTEAAFTKLITLPSIGVKTAACTLLFCMQRPSFAVDTHVFRICKWLGWVPEKATRDTTFSHCDVRIPNHLKYSLHQLFIKHGQKCGRCKAGTTEGTADWEKVVCPIEHLVKRTGKTKGDRPAKKGKGKKDDEDEDDGEEEIETGEEEHKEGVEEPSETPKVTAKTAKRVATKPATKPGKAGGRKVATRKAATKSKSKKTAESTDDENTSGEVTAGEQDSDYMGE